MKTLLALLLTLMPAMGSAQWKVVSQSKPVSLGAGAWRLTKQVVSVDARRPVELNLVFWKSSLCELRVAMQENKAKALTLEALAKQNAKTFAACNGGYFTPANFLPVGLQIAGGKREGEFLKGMPSGGGVWVRGGKPHLYIDAEYNGTDGIAELLQCCPLLVVDGRAVSGTGDDPAERRTFLLTDGKEIWAMGVSDAIGLRALAAVLANPAIISECKVSRALNLDGGPSTGLWSKDDKGTEQYIPEMWRVKNIFYLTP